MRDLASEFESLQRDHLLAAWRADLAGSTTPHVVIALPSYSVDRTVYEHYGARLPPLENRYIYALLRAREPATRVVYLSSLPVPDDVLSGYLDLIDPASRAAVRADGHVVSPGDPSSRPLAEKILDRGDVVDDLRAFIGDLPALVEAWNVSESEAELAVALGAPVNGTHPDLRPLASKSNGRRLLRDAGVPVPEGVEDVRSVDDVVAAVGEIRRRRPGLAGVVVKLDDSVAGDGNLILPTRDDFRRHDVAAALPEWYVAALRAGGIVEELVEGDELRSPSAQGNITPTGEVDVIATHEQRLGGDHGQVYEGCSFPAHAGYSPALAHHTAAAGRALADAGAIGRFSVDFVACRRNGAWVVHALEINLRKGGTTHPYGISRLVRGGRYDAVAGRYVGDDGRALCYAATDNLVDPGWVGRPPADVRAAIAAAGLAFERGTGSGVVPHLLDCLAVDGRMGYTAIADTPAAVAALEERLLSALS